MADARIRIFMWARLTHRAEIEHAADQAVYHKCARFGPYAGPDADTATLAWGDRYIRPLYAPALMAASDALFGDDPAYQRRSTARGGHEVLTLAGEHVAGWEVLENAAASLTPMTIAQAMTARGMVKVEERLEDSFTPIDSHPRDEDDPGALLSLAQIQALEASIAAALLVRYPEESVDQAQADLQVGPLLGARLYS